MEHLAAKIAYYWKPFSLESKRGLLSQLKPKALKRHCQQDPQQMETGESADHHETIFFGLLVQKSLNFMTNFGQNF